MITSVIGLVVSALLYGTFYVLGWMHVVAYSLALYSVCSIVLVVCIFAKLSRGDKR